MHLTRREAIERFSRLMAGSPLVSCLLAQDGREGLYLPERIPPLGEIVNAFEISEIARLKLPRPVYDHIAAGAGGEKTLRRNRKFFDRITFRPRVLVNVEKLDISTELLGQPLSAPILAGPTARHDRVHPDGEFATVDGAQAANTAVVISHRSSKPIQTIAKRAEQPVWFQVDAYPKEAQTREKVEQAVASGCKVVCLTLGQPYRAPLARDIRNRYETKGRTAWPPDSGKLVPHWTPQVTWELLERVKEWAGVPVLLKGVLSPQEARMAVRRGADGVVVSNHGGRAADGLPATIEQLPKIAEAVGGRVPILIDGGFRRGTDILKALAFGADAVLLGRPVLWALAAYGAEGVQKLFRMLQHELALAMGLSGQPNLDAVSRKLVRLHTR